MHYGERFPDLRYRVFDGRAACTVGLGACREHGEESVDAIAFAIRNGCNVIDTAPHYHRGTHERAVGEAVAAVVRDGVCSRDDLIVCTKVGVVPALVENNADSLGFARLKAFIEEHYVRPGLFGWDELADAEHTLAPAFVRRSAEASLERLGTIDCLFLDAPERQLGIATHTEVFRRIAAAIEVLEDLCASGRVRTWGVNTRSAVPIRRVAALAHAVAGARHHFRALRVHLSLLRSEVLDSPLCAAARELGLHVFGAQCLDGGSPQYRFPPELDAVLGETSSDAAAAIRWVASVPQLGTAVFGSRDVRHIRANLAAASLPPLDAGLYVREGSTP